jgi:hypothetical protein
VRSELAENDQIDPSVVVDFLKHFPKWDDRVVLAKEVNCLPAFHRLEESPGSDGKVSLDTSISIRSLSHMGVARHAAKMPLICEIASLRSRWSFGMQVVSIQ